MKTNKVKAFGKDWTDGQLNFPKHLTEENAWQKTYDWNSNDDTVYISRNGITKEERPLTREQYRDTNYTLNERG